MIVKPFRGLRPRPRYARQVACRPYDVLDAAEARREAAGNPRSFLHVVKPDLALPAGADPRAAAVYQAGRDRFQALMADGVFLREEKESFYLYELSRDGHAQDGVVACAAVEDYRRGRIRRHELTRPDKEDDRKEHIRATMLHAEPVMFAYRAEAALEARIAAAKTACEPVYDFQDSDGARHRLRVLDDPAAVAAVTRGFAAVPACYIADGHHRSAAAARVAAELAAANPRHRGDEEYNYFLAVYFPDRRMRILAYHRVVADLNGLSAERFLARLDEAFAVEKIGGERAFSNKAPAIKGEPAAGLVARESLSLASHEPQALSSHEPQALPQAPRTLGMYLAGDWYRLRARPETVAADDPVAALDVSLLSRRVLEPILNIRDPRRDPRLDFVGGDRGPRELQGLVDNGNAAAAFALHPIAMPQLLQIADQGLLMPPKATWFDPKLRSGLIAHSLRDE